MSSPDLPTITVCRGCCCGTEAKHPGIDHAARLERLREQADGVARVRIADCLGPCERSDVIVVGPSRKARRAGARTVWMGRISSDAVLADVARWAADGGPGVADAPPSVAARTFRLER
ncbi:MAG: (2Fe-2S) ferredoxin domain-containing protein [Marmoricola sp.]